MKTDVDTCLKDLAEWYVRNRRQMTEPEFDEVLRRHCVSDSEVKKMADFIESKPGTLRFKTLLQERQVQAIPKTTVASLGFAEVEIPVAKALEATAGETPSSSGFHIHLNQRWTIVYEGKISDKAAMAAIRAGLEVSYREAPKGTGHMLTDVSLPGVKASDARGATRVFDRFAELYGKPSMLREKEPWQMTREEWYSSPLKAELEAAHDEELMALPQSGEALKSAIKSLGAKYEALGIGVEHSLIVARALSEGKGVSSDVLKDYPELLMGRPGASLLYEPERCEIVPSQYFDLLPLLGALPPASLLLEPSTKERKIDEALQKLKQGVESIQSSANFREFLLTMSKFHVYSIGNQLLIMVQRRNATRVAGFQTWKGLGRTVMAGETGIMILAPCVGAPKFICPLCRQGPMTEAGLRKHLETHPGADIPGEIRKAKAGTEEEVAMYFKVVYVFDVSQTQGKALPEVEVPVLTGEANEELFAKVMEHLKQQGVSVSFESRPNQDPEIKGMYQGRAIWVRPEESRAQQLKTLIHETAHYYTESVFGVPRADAETIAESVAFAVGAHWGFDSGTRSFPYVAVWSKDKKVLDKNLDTIRRVVTSLIDALEK
jgi:uncharacterized protein